MRDPVEVEDGKFECPPANDNMQIRMEEGMSRVSELQVGPRREVHVYQLVVDASAQERGQ